MLTFEPHTFGELNADDYDAFHDPGNTDAAVALISELAGDGRILELAIGTGRIALPLAARGHRIEGMDASPEMVAKLREKPGGDAIPVAIADMADVGVDGPFEMAVLVFNTLFNLTTQDAQVRCFQNVAGRLAPGGRFLVEAFVPDPGRFADGQTVRTMRLDMTSVWLETAFHDPVTQQVASQRVRITPEGVKLVPLLMRYAWPAEMDLMAQMAGLTLEARWADFVRTPFTAKSGAHVSLYRKPR